ncbi:MAG: hypothetical protein KIT73_01515 [Burkholderiales bacterium]|nr:hypothetical protein [Burkholderiales bacterium]
MTIERGNPTWSGGFDDLVLTVTDTALGEFTITAWSGTWEQIDADYVVGGWGSSWGGTPGRRHHRSGQRHPWRRLQRGGCFAGACARRRI